MKFALTAVPERYVLPGRPSAGTAPLDAYKQTQFLLGEDLALLERAMNLQLAIVRENKKARSAAAAAVLSLWSRTFSLLSGACELMSAGSYIACPPLLRAALDGVAAQRSLTAGAFDEYRRWFEDAVSQAPQHQALAFDLGRYRAGSVLAEDEALAAVYRLLTDLSIPHFGSTALQVSPDSNLQKMSMAFADNAFHLGWAELTSGWLLLLAGSQLSLLVEQNALLVNDASRREIGTITAKVRSTIESPRRCRVEEIDGRFLFHNFRRAASGQPRRVIL
jgi:hypothetical protein